MNDPTTDLSLAIKQLLIESLQLEDTLPADIDDDALLFDPSGMGFDSIDALELGVALRKKYQLKLDAKDASNREHFRSVLSLAAWVASKQP
jgi:acyl carrier protein